MSNNNNFEWNHIGPGLYDLVDCGTNSVVAILAIEDDSWHGYIPENESNIMPEKKGKTYIERNLMAEKICRELHIYPTPEFR